MPYDIKRVDLPNSVSLPYVEQGDPTGVPVLLLHGFAGSWRSFSRLLPHLPPWMHVFALTQRGHGQASHPLEGYGVQDLAADVAAFLEALQLPRSIVVGHSMGAAVAQRLGAAYTHKTLALVLVSTRASMRERPGMQKMWETTISKLTDPVDAKFVRTFLENVFEKPLPDSFTETIFQDALKVPAHVWKETFAAALETDLASDLEKIRAPCLLIWGAEDATVPQGDREAIAATIANCRRKVYPEVGHGAHAETPERLACDLVAFVQEQATVDRL